MRGRGWVRLETVLLYMSKRELTRTACDFISGKDRLTPEIPFFFGKRIRSALLRISAVKQVYISDVY